MPNVPDQASFSRSRVIGDQYAVPVGQVLDYMVPHVIASPSASHSVRRSNRFMPSDLTLPARTARFHLFFRSMSTISPDAYFETPVRGSVRESTRDRSVNLVRLNYLAVAPLRDTMNAKARSPRGGKARWLIYHVAA